MTIELTIPTPFADLAELTENFAQRVDEQRLMLPHAEPAPEGEWVRFTVLLADGSAAFAGVGRVQGSYDNGEEHPPEYRYDVVLDSLQLEGTNEVLFERLLVARETQTRGEPVTGEVSVEDVERQVAAAPADEGGWEDVADDVTTAAPSEPAPAPAPRAEDAPGSAPRATQAAAAPAGRGRRATGEASRGAGRLPSPHAFDGVVLTRPSLPAAWMPEPMPRPAPAQSSGLFDYPSGLPIPTRPPRPDVDPSQRVQPAPRPGAPWPRRQTGAVTRPSSRPERGFDEPAVEESAPLGEATSQYEAPPGQPDGEGW